MMPSSSLAFTLLAQDALSPEEKGFTIWLSGFCSLTIINLFAKA